MGRNYGHKNVLKFTDCHEKRQKGFVHSNIYLFRWRNSMKPWIVAERWKENEVLIGGSNIIPIDFKRRHVPALSSVRNFFFCFDHSKGLGNVIFEEFFKDGGQKNMKNFWAGKKGVLSNRGKRFRWIWMKLAWNITKRSLECETCKICLHFSYKKHLWTQFLWFFIEQKINKLHVLKARVPFHLQFFQASSIYMNKQYVSGAS